MSSIGQSDGYCYGGRGYYHGERHFQGCCHGDGGARSILGQRGQVQYLLCVQVGRKMEEDFPWIFFQFVHHIW